MERNLYFKSNCGKHMAVDESGAGRTVKCPSCGQPLQIPRPDMEWDCSCGAPMILSANMVGETVRCLVCKASYKVPELAPSADTPGQKELLPEDNPRVSVPAAPQTKKTIVRIHRPQT